MFVTTQTPYRTKDQPAMDRTVRLKAQQRCKQISQHAGEHAAVVFFNVLAGAELLAKTEEHLPQYRERLYPPTVALAMFIKHALSEDRSCQNAVNAGQRSAPRRGWRLTGLAPVAIARLGNAYRWRW
jgi:hypothetical protein